MNLLTWLDRLGRVLLAGFEDLGRFFSILAQAVLWTPRPPFDGREWLRQMVRVGWDTIAVVLLTCLFTGMVLPLLTLLGDAIGIFGGWLVSVGLYGANSYIHLERTFQFLEVDDVTSGLIKAAFFGLFMLVALVVLGVFILEIEDIPIGERGARPQVTARFPSVAGIDREAAVN